MSGMPKALRIQQKVADKQNKCCECSTVINVGDKYQYYSGIWDGHPDSFKQCLNCG